MKLLALDTSTEYLSLALWLDGEIRARDVLAGQKHSQLILPMLAEMLAESGLALTDLDGIVFGAGPGSFTGLRIGCGVAQGLAFGANLRVVGVSTLLALAQRAGHARVAACLDARMGEVYFAAYARQGDDWETVHEPGLYAPQQVPALQGDGWHGVGSGWQAYGSVLHAAYGSRIAHIDGQAFPHASDIALLASRQFARGASCSADDAAPIYVRNKVALKTSAR